MDYNLNASTNTTPVGAATVGDMPPVSVLTVRKDSMNKLASER